MDLGFSTPAADSNMRNMNGGYEPTCSADMIVPGLFGPLA
jgi:hypothetical protein